MHDNVIFIVGAGLGGLAAARTLHQRAVLPYLGQGANSSLEVGPVPAPGIGAKAATD